jgi:hypothetical protein
LKRKSRRRLHEARKNERNRIGNGSEKGSEYSQPTLPNINVDLNQQQYATYPLHTQDQFSDAGSYYQYGSDQRYAQPRLPGAADRGYYNYGNGGAQYYDQPAGNYISGRVSDTSSVSGHQGMGNYGNGPTYALRKPSDSHDDHRYL